MVSQEQRSRGTRAALVRAATARFGERGYVATSLAELTRAAGVSKGAFYHHFTDKRQLFEAVFGELERRAVDAITAASAEHPGDPWQRATAGLEAFLLECTRADYRRIVLVEGPIALGPARWRELDERYLAGLLRGALAGLLGDTAPERLDLLTRAMFGFLCELALGIAEADDQDVARAAAADLARRALAGLAAPAP